ncbi:hypothetical protein K4G58_04415 [Helicobacter sp. Faydin-H64]|uniref:Uncharacterized protein n=1 Tax=Helicobacter turcicus TaxID=2867412 RepID=A0ABS7JN42_9HELI|nr:hypothetical protein [Helicobacter turcicus]MBX7545569.1 hypothetical protein [Helicobacter turcicus]
MLGGGYYFLNQPSGQALLSKAQNSLGIAQESTLDYKDSDSVVDFSNATYAKDDEIRRLQNALYQKERELENLAHSLEGLNASVKEIQNSQQNTMQKLRYTLKPKQQIIAECFSMEIGKWDIPKSCLLSIATKVDKELQNDKRVVAFEVQGIVDTNPYRGLSPELKQEGLASFRAWNAIRSINAKIPNATIFEGPSIQLANKRGYSIKAYFVD